MTNPILKVNGVAGRLYHADQLGLVAFVPEACFDAPGRFDEAQYSASPWPKLNLAAQAGGIGSQLFPELTEPITDVGDHRRFLRELRSLAALRLPRR